MGSFFSILKKAKSSKEILEEVEQKIKRHEISRRLYEHRLRSSALDLLLVCIPLYLVGLFGFYYFLPDEAYDRMLWTIFFICFPVIIYCFKKFLDYWYSQNINQINLNLIELKDMKKKALDEVMDKETYKVAKEILERFDPASKQLQMFNAQMVNQNNSSLRRREAAAEKDKKNNSNANMSAESADLLLRQQLLHQEKIIKEQNLQLLHQKSQQLQLSKLHDKSMRLDKTGDSDVVSVSRQDQHSINKSETINTVNEDNRTKLEASTNCEEQEDKYLHLMPGTATDDRYSPVAHPILPKDRSAVDKLMDYFVGDGPTNRYALICSKCAGHNGMSLKEEFEYITFRCAYCRYLNPARKKRQSAPPLHDSLSESATKSMQVSDSKSLIGTPASKKSQIYTSTPKTKEVTQTAQAPKVSEATALTAVTEESTISDGVKKSDA